MNDIVRQYKVIYSGDVLPGTTREEVRLKVTQKLKLSDSASQRLFQQNSKARVIKRLTTLDKANSFRNKLNSLGMVLDIEEEVLEQPNEDGIENKLELIPKSENYSANLSDENEPTMGDSVESSEQAHNENAIFTVIERYLNISTFLILLGLTFCVIYLPFPDGFLRKGFLLGAAILLFGVRSFRRRSI